MKKKFILSIFIFCPLQTTNLCVPDSIEIKETDLFDDAVDCIKKYEGWHSAKNHPYIGYGHRLLPGEAIGANISETFADSLLRQDLRQKCSVFRRFGKDSLILGVLAYNVGENRLLGYGKRLKSKLIQKLETGDRDIYHEYISFRMFNGKIVPSIEKRRKDEFQLLFNKTKSIKTKSMIKEGSSVVIVPSEELSKMKLDDLVEKKGVIIEDLNYSRRKYKGYMIRLSESPILGEYVWFIPSCSVKVNE